MAEVMLLRDVPGLVLRIKISRAPRFQCAPFVRARGLKLRCWIEPWALISAICFEPIFISRELCTVTVNEKPLSSPPPPQRKRS